MPAKSNHQPLIAELSVGSLVQLVGPPGIWMIERFAARKVILRRMSEHNQPSEVPMKTYEDGWAAGYKARMNEEPNTAVLQAVLDAIKGTLDPHSQIADHPNVKFAQAERQKLVAGAGARRDRLRGLVDAQANDDGLWFVARTAPEAYLQQALRRLHAAVEAL